MSNKIKDNWFDTILYLPLISLFTAAFIVPGWDKKIVVLFSVSIIAIICKYGFKTIRENYKDPYVVILLITTLYGSFLYETIGYASGEIRTLIAISLFTLCFPKDKISLKCLPHFLLLSAIISCCYYLYIKFYLDIPRGAEPINPIPYSIALCLFSIVSLYFFFKKKNNLILLAFLIFSITIVLTETRGAILTLFISLIFLLFLKIKEKRNLKKIITTTVIGSIITLVFSYGIVNARVNETVAEIKSINHGNYNTSIGLRLQMWKASPKLVSINPAFGLGNQHKEELQKLYKNGDIQESLALYAPTHYHNQYIDKAIKSGVIGLILFLLVIYYPAYYYYKNKKNRNSDEAQLTFTLTLAFSIACLTDTPFSQSFTLLPLLLLFYFILSKSKLDN
ncbi:O-antigen ligase family protein [Photobacterium satsumensis]|uniref:O-antigen ligase family protein n=1 Tax=Photobacterium satsumensis TaxID=2910239 RepID=UPI003D09AA16